MNKFQCLLVVLLIFNSCENTIEDRIPAFQAHVNGVQFWEASSFSIITDSNGTIITRNNLSGTLTMYVPSLEVSVNNLGSSEVAVGVFQDTLYYSTMYNGIASIAHLSDGEITIDEFNSEIIAAFDELKNKETDRQKVYDMIKEGNLPSDESEVNEKDSNWAEKIEEVES